MARKPSKGKHAAKRAEASQASGVRGSFRRRSITPGQVERVALWLDRDVALRLRERAARDRMSLSTAVEAALREYLA